VSEYPPLYAGYAGVRPATAKRTRRKNSSRANAHAHAANLTTVQDLKNNQRGASLLAPGVLLLDGGVFTTGGSFRYRHCAYPTRSAKGSNGQITAVSGMTARCLNSPYFSLMDRPLPQTARVEGDGCNCSGSFTVAREDLPNTHQTYLWGTTEWSIHFHGRNASDAANAMEEHHLDIGPHSVRIRANK